jgi:hypothetical protein
MECLLSPDPRDERIAQAEERLRAAAMRMSQPKSCSEKHEGASLSGISR